MYVLYADNDPEDIDVFREALNKINPGISLIALSSAEELLNFLQGQIIPDLIFLDINMPGMNGLECLKVIRANSKWDNLSIVMFSTSIRSEYSEKYGYPKTTFIVKPNTFIDLLHIISTALREIA